MHDRALLLLALFAALLGGAGPARAYEGATYRFEVGGRIRAVRTLDVGGDGRADLVLIVEDERGEAALVLRTPGRPAPRHFYGPGDVTRIDCRAGDCARAGAIALGRFGPGGEACLRFLGPAGALDVAPDGTPLQGVGRRAPPALLARSDGQPIVFWDAVHDLDGDGLDETWYPLARGDGPIHVLAGKAAGDRVLALAARNMATSTPGRPVARHAYVPNLVPGDVDGDGATDLVALEDAHLLAWSVRDEPPAPGEPLAPSFRLHLPFLEDDPEREPGAMRTPRIQVADVDGDGTADLLVTLITGERDRLESLRTIFFHFPGPVRDPATGGPVAPRARIDTQSIVLHPTFVDLDGDGDLDYVGDSMRGGRFDLIARLLGRDPDLTFVAFRYDGTRGTYERVPYFTVSRTYASSETLSNRFGRSASFAGDFDGDGHKDLLDLGNLEGVEILRGARADGRRRGGMTFADPILRRVPVESSLVADVIVADLDGDGRDDFVAWSGQTLYLAVSGREPR